MEEVKLICPKCGSTFIRYSLYVYENCPFCGTKGEIEKSLIKSEVFSTRYTATVKCPCLTSGIN